MDKIRVLSARHPHNHRHHPAHDPHRPASADGREPPLLTGLLGPPPPRASPPGRRCGRNPAASAGITPCITSGPADPPRPALFIPRPSPSPPPRWPANAHRQNPHLSKPSGVLTLLPETASHFLKRRPIGSSHPPADRSPLPQAPAAGPLLPPQGASGDQGRRLCRGGAGSSVLDVLPEWDLRRRLLSWR